MTLEELTEAGVRAVALVLVDNGGIARMKCVPIERRARRPSAGSAGPSVWGLSLARRLVRAPARSLQPVRRRPAPRRSGRGGARRVRARLGVGADRPPRAVGRALAGCQRWFLRRMVARGGAQGSRSWRPGSSSGCGPRRTAAFARSTRARATAPRRSARPGPLMLDAGRRARRVGSPGRAGPSRVRGRPDGDLASPRRSAGRLRRVGPRPSRRPLGRGANTAWRRASRRGWWPGRSGTVSHLHFSVWVGRREPVRRRRRARGASSPRRGVPRRRAQAAAGHDGDRRALALSYERLQPSHWAGVYACWGNENREAALRLEGAGGPSATTCCQRRVEVGRRRGESLPRHSARSSRRASTASTAVSSCRLPSAEDPADLAGGRARSRIHRASARDPRRCGRVAGRVGRAPRGDGGLPARPRRRRPPRRGGSGRRSRRGGARPRYRWRF